MEQQVHTEVTTATAAEAAPTDRPDSLAAALGQDGPGIAAEIESELLGTAEPAADSPDEANAAPEPTTAEPTTAAAEPAASAPTAAPASAAIQNLGILSDLEVTVTARLCATTQPLGAVLSMQPGSILNLGRATNAPIELVANGVIVAYGEVVAVGDSLGVRITGLPNS